MEVGERDGDGDGDGVRDRRGMPEQTSFAGHAIAEIIVEDHDEHSSSSNDVDDGANVTADLQEGARPSIADIVADLLRQPSEDMRAVSQETQALVMHIADHIGTHPVDSLPSLTPPRCDPATDSDADGGDDDEEEEGGEEGVSRAQRRHDRNSRHPKSPSIDFQVGAICEEAIFEEEEERCGPRGSADPAECHGDQHSSDADGDATLLMQQSPTTPTSTNATILKLSRPSSSSKQRLLCISPTDTAILHTLCVDSVESLAALLERAFLLRYGPVVVNHVPGNASLAHKSELTSTHMSLTSILTWFVSLPVTPMVAECWSQAHALVGPEASVRRHVATSIYDWIASQKQAPSPASFPQVQALLVLGLTDVWSAIRRACAAKLGDVLGVLTIAQMQALYEKLAETCTGDDATPWQAIEGAVQGIGAILRKFIWVSKARKDPKGNTLPVYKLSLATSSLSDRSDFHLMFGDTLFKTGLPSFLVDGISTIIYDLLAHEQLSIREYATKAYSAFLSRSPFHEALQMLEQVVRRLRRKQKRRFLFDQTADARHRAPAVASTSAPQSEDEPRPTSATAAHAPPFEVLGAHEAEGLLGVCHFILKHIPPGFLLPKWPLFYSTFSVYLAHPASTVRQATSTVFKYIVAKDSSNPIMLKLVLQGLASEWPTDTLRLTAEELGGHTKPLETDVAISWQAKEGRLLAYELILRFCITNHVHYVFPTFLLGTPYKPKQGVEQLEDPHKSNIPSRRFRRLLSIPNVKRETTRRHNRASSHHIFEEPSSDVRGVPARPLTSHTHDHDQQLAAVAAARKDVFQSKSSDVPSPSAPLKIATDRLIEGSADDTGKKDALSLASAPHVPDILRLDDSLPASPAKGTLPQASSCDAAVTIDHCEEGSEERHDQPHNQLQADPAVPTSTSTASLHLSDSNEILGRDSSSVVVAIASADDEAGVQQALLVSPRRRSNSSGDGPKSKQVRASAMDHSASRPLSLADASQCSPSATSPSSTTSPARSPSVRVSSDDMLASSPGMPSVDSIESFSELSSYRHRAIPRSTSRRTTLLHQTLEHAASTTEPQRPLRHASYHQVRVDLLSKTLSTEWNASMKKGDSLISQLCALDLVRDDATASTSSSARTSISAANSLTVLRPPRSAGSSTLTSEFSTAADAEKRKSQPRWIESGEVMRAGLHGTDTNNSVAKNAPHLASTKDSLPAKPSRGGSLAELQVPKLDGSAPRSQAIFVDSLMNPKDAPAPTPATAPCPDAVLSTLYQSPLWTAKSQENKLLAEHILALDEFGANDLSWDDSPHSKELFVQGKEVELDATEASVPSLQGHNATSCGDQRANDACSEAVVPSSHEHARICVGSSNETSDGNNDDDDDDDDGDDYDDDDDDNALPFTDFDDSNGGNQRRKTSVHYALRHYRSTSFTDESMYLNALQNPLPQSAVDDLTRPASGRLRRTQSLSTASRTNLREKMRNFQRRKKASESDEKLSGVPKWADTTRFQPLSVVLLHILYQVVESVGSQQFELQRMGKAVLPLLTEMMRWFDPVTLNEFWTSGGFDAPTWWAHVMALSLKQSTAHVVWMNSYFRTNAMSLASRQCGAHCRGMVDFVTQHVVALLPSILRRGCTGPVFDVSSLVCMEQCCLVAASLRQGLPIDFIDQAISVRLFALAVSAFPVSRGLLSLRQGFEATFSSELTKHNCEWPDTASSSDSDASGERRGLRLDPGRMLPPHAIPPSAPQNVIGRIVFKHVMDYLGSLLSDWADVCDLRAALFALPAALKSLPIVHDDEATFKHTIECIHRIVDRCGYTHWYSVDQNKAHTKKEKAQDGLPPTSSAADRVVSGDTSLADLDLHGEADLKMVQHLFTSFEFTPLSTRSDSHSTPKPSSSLPRCKTPAAASPPRNFEDIFIGKLIPFSFQSLLTVIQLDSCDSTMLRKVLDVVRTLLVASGYTLHLKQYLETLLLKMKANQRAASPVLAASLDMLTQSGNFVTAGHQHHHQNKDIGAPDSDSDVDEEDSGGECVPRSNDHSGTRLPSASNGDDDDDDWDSWDDEDEADVVVVEIISEALVQWRDILSSGMMRERLAWSSVYYGQQMPTFDFVVNQLDRSSRATIAEALAQRKQAEEQMLLMAQHQGHYQHQFGPQQRSRQQSQQFTNAQHKTFGQPQHGHRHSSPHTPGVPRASGERSNVFLPEETHGELYASHGLARASNGGLHPDDGSANGQHIERRRSANQLQAQPPLQDDGTRRPSKPMRMSIF